MYCNLSPPSNPYIVGTAGKKGGASGHWAPSNADEDANQPGLRDKKFEGYSNLKGGSDPTAKKAHSNFDHAYKAENALAKGLEEEYILNM